MSRPSQVRLSGRSKEEIKKVQIEIYGDLKTATKTCTKCKANKPLSEFTSDKNKLDGLYSSCKICKRAQDRSRAKSDEQIKKIQASLPTRMKKCTKCEVEKDISNFATCRQSPDGLKTYCRKCKSDHHKNYIEKLKKRSPEEIDDYKKKKFKTDNPEEMKKTCYNCGIEKSLEEFVESPSQADGLTSECIPCGRIRCRDNMRRRYQYIRNSKIGKSCEECGYDNIYGLTYAHFNRDDKFRANTGLKVNPSALSIEQFEEEKSKMRILCRNCHAMSTYDEAEELKKNRVLDGPSAASAKIVRKKQDYVQAEKLRRKHCVDCKLEVIPPYFIIFEFDHLPGFTKVKHISGMVINSARFEVIENEMKKCAMRCANCHSLKTAERKIIDESLTPLLLPNLIVFILAYGG